MSLIAARENMVDSQVRTSDVSDPALQAAMRRVRREDYVAAAQADLAYAELNHRVAEDRWLLQPREAAKLLQAMKPRDGERALVICEPYVAAVLAHAGCEVVALDTPTVTARTEAALTGEGVETLSGDPAAPAVDGEFDLIVGGGSVVQPPAAWIDRLRDGGRLGVMVRDGALGRATLLIRAGGAVSGRAVFEAAPPWLPGCAPRPAFAF